MEINNKDLYKYCENYSKDTLNVLKQLERETHLKVFRPRMISGFLQGKFIGFLVDMIKPKQILEIGTYTGYSAIAMANYLDENAKITTIESNIELKHIIEKYIEMARMNKKIELIIGDALEVIPKLNQKFDLIFLDADKKNYSNYLKILDNNMNLGAYLIADNVLWSGKVINETQDKDIDTKSIKEFNEIIYKSEKYDNIILPFRDGLNIIKKIKW